MKVKSYKLNKILMGVLLFLCSLVFSIDVYAWYEVTLNYQRDTKKLKMFYDPGVDGTIYGAYAVCKTGSTTINAVFMGKIAGNYDSQLTTATTIPNFATYDISSWASGTYICTSYLTQFDKYDDKTKKYKYKANKEVKISFVHEKSNKYSSFKVVFDAKGGTVEGGPSYTRICSSTSGTPSCAFDAPTPSWSGHEFKGWSTRSKDPCSSINIPYGQGRGKVYTSATTYYACWKPVDDSSTVTPPPPAIPPSGTPVTQYKIVFDFNGGYYTGEAGKLCSSPLVEGSNICSGTVKKGTSVTIPSKELVKGNNKLIGYSLAECVDTNFVKEDTITVNSNAKYYACYQQDINGDRYANTDIIDVNTKKQIYSCGQSINITYCITESDGTMYCFDSNGNKFLRNSLASTEAGANCKVPISNDNNANNGRTNIYDWMYATKNIKSKKGIEYACGSQIWIEYSISEVGYFYTNTKNESDSFSGFSGLTSDINSVKCSSEEKDNSVRYTTIKSSDFECGEEIRVYDCEDGGCKFKTTDNESGTISENNFVSEQSDANKECDKINVSRSKYVCNPTKYTKQEGTSLVSVCFDEDDEDEDILNELKNIYKCNTNDGYKFDELEVVYEEDTRECNDSKGKCVATYSVTCSQDEKNIKPNMEVTSGMVGSDGYGEIKVAANSKSGKIYAYYVSEEFVTPSNKVNWTKVNGNIFTIKTTPGVKYIWVKDNKNNISNAVSGAVLDTINTNTTISNLELRDGSGVIQTAERVSYNDDVITSSKYALLSNNLGKESKVLADGFNPFDMEYKLEVSSPTISVYATLTSKDASYVEGYEPRTVNLSYGINTILIKIKNNEGKVRTYTILVTRTDERNADNTLNNISLSVGSINFNANVTDYKIEIPKNTTTVNVSSIISSDVAKYVEGYEPGNVTITGDTTVKLIKVMSETGSTRTYVLTFVKEGTDVITDETLQLNDLVIPGAYFSFEKGIANYSTTVGYETESIDIRLNLKDETSTYVVGSKQSVNGEYVYGSNLGVNLKVGENFIIIKITNTNGESSYYRLTVIRKEFGLEVENDNTLKDLKVLGVKEYDIDFNPNVKEYTVKIKQEKSLVITAVPNSNRAEVFIRGNDELTGFSTVRVKVVAENGEFITYSIDIKKDAFNKPIEISAIIIGTVIILGSSAIIVIKKKNKSRKEYYEE